MRWPRISGFACRCLAGLVFLHTAASAQIINTIAGGRLADSGVAITTSLYPAGVVVDAGGNIFISSTGGRVYKVTPAGILLVVAGNGVTGFSGDNGPATSAQLQSPDALALDSMGNLYIADGGNYRIRKVATDGTISTFAGSGVAGFEGDGAAANAARLNGVSSICFDTNGNLLIADTQNNRIRNVTPTGTISTIAGGIGVGLDGGLARDAVLSGPTDVKVDASGNIYIADLGHQRIRKINSAGMISTVVGIGSQGFSGDGGPATMAAIYDAHSVALDASGVLYIADTRNNRVRRVALDGTISTFAGTGVYGFTGDGGPALSANFANPRLITMDVNGNLFVVDRSDRVRKISTDGSVVTVAGNGIGDGGLATRATLSGPIGVAVDAIGNQFIVEYYGHRVRKLTPGGQISTIAGTGVDGFSGDGGPATQAKLNYPSGIAVDATGNVYIADTPNNRIRKVTPGGIITTVAGDGTGTCGSCGIGFGTANGDGGPAVNAKIYNPDFVAVDSDGNLYISEGYNGRIRKVAPDGKISTYVGGGFVAGNIDGVPANSISLYHPAGIAVDPAGNLFIAMSSNSVIRKVTTDGLISTIAGNGVYGFSGDGGPALSANINYPRNLVVDAVGNLYFSSTYSERIRKVTPGGVISTVAGTGISGFSGDGGPAINAQVNSPIGLAVDADANLLLTDDARVRKVTFPFSLASVVSRKAHSAIDTFNFPVDPNPLINGRISVEPRNLGAGHAIAFRFNEPVMSVGAISVVDSAANPIGNFSSPVLTGKDLVLRIKGIPDNRRVKITVAGINDSLDVSTSIGFLVGDFNSSGSTNSSDINAIKARSGQATSTRNFKFDINASGTVDSSDISAVKARSGLTLQ